MIDRVLKLLDRHPDRSAVIATSLDWSAAFNRQDPTPAIVKFVKLGVRPFIIPLLASYLTNRKMKVKFNTETSEFYSLIGGGPQGTLLGGLEYMAQSNDNADCVDAEDSFKYIDDLSVLQLVLLSGLLVDYNFHTHVASDIAIDQKFLPPVMFESQKTINSIENWTKAHLMKLNAAKCTYMLFSRSAEKFSTRLTVEGKNIEQVSVAKLLGVWISEDLSWSRNCKEICIKAYSRLSMITKLRYVGVSVEDLLDIYILFIRSVAEYCSVAFHSSLTQCQSNKLENIQKTCLKVILGDMYISYSAALEMCCLETLYDRRQKRCLEFALKNMKHNRNKKMFPLNLTMDTRKENM